MRISVIGHRSVADRSRAVDATRACLRSIVGDPAEGPAFDLLSNLAEGGDRLAAEAGEAWPRMRLIAVLPLPQSDYARDFDSPVSREAFAAALRQAADVVELPAAESRPAAYRQAARYLVDHADHLIALWDGRPGDKPGGTADTLAYARERLDASRIHVVTVARGPVGASR
jgi:hypothetical protein